MQGRGKKNMEKPRHELVSCPVRLKKMRYLAAYMLASLGGNKNPSASDIEKILSSVGIEVDKERSKKIVSELGGKDINEIISNEEGIKG
ncbi:transposable element Tc3 transposase [Trichonephila clavata]|uniref:Large ribosomal subunit protein P2 n=1 Tax=Trichonephila clavata TaxID=2740835 RepID=A0A8X6KP85_TRICU|nr:transposable element Tc3 transposase [Trichonephila clavata]